MSNIRVTNRFVRANLLVALVVVVAFRVVFRGEQSPSRCVQGFPIHLPH